MIKFKNLRPVKEMITLDADSKAKQQINFIGNLAQERNENKSY